MVKPFCLTTNPESQESVVVGTGEGWAGGRAELAGDWPELQQMGALQGGTARLSGVGNKHHSLEKQMEKIYYR